MNNYIYLNGEEKDYPISVWIERFPI